MAKISDFGRIFLLLLLSLVIINASRVRVRDVCVQGGGPAGMSMAAFLKDNGYDVLVLESQSTTGGHCDTFNFVPPSGQTDNWIDIGANGFWNSTALNAAGFGHWTLDNIAFINRFNPLGVGSIPALAVQNINIQNSSLAPPFPVTPEFGVSFQNWLNIMQQYNWSDSGIFYGKIPTELLMTFKDYAILKNLNHMPDITHLYGFSGGFAYGNYSNILALNMITSMSRVTMAIIGLAGPTGQFQINGGCIQLYNGITNYLGSQNVITNAQVTKVKRHENGNRPIKIKGTANGEAFKYKCKKYVVAFPPVLEKIQFMNPDSLETKLFKHVNYRYFYTGLLTNTTGPYQNSAGFFLNTDPSSTYYAPFVASVTTIGRLLPYGPYAIQLISPTEITSAQARQIMLDSLANMTSTVFHTYTLQTIFPHGNYGPHFDVESLSKNISPFAKLRDLQGHQNTYYIGALQSMISASTYIWERSKLMVDEYFPPVY